MKLLRTANLTNETEIVELDDYLSIIEDAYFKGFDVEKALTDGKILETISASYQLYENY